MSKPYAPLHVEMRGQPPGSAVETFLLIHGFGASTHTWRHWTPYLEERGRVILVDMKGFGASDKPEDGGYGPEDQAELVHRVVAGEDPARLTLVGHSLGGGVALLLAVTLAAKRDQRLERLVLVASPAYTQRLPPFVTLARFPRLTHAALRLIGAPRVIRQVLRSIVYDPTTVDDEQVRAYSAPLLTGDGVRGMLRAGRAIVPDRLDEISQRYPMVDVPTLLVWGRQDRVIPLSIGERLAAALPNAQLEIMPSCGHVPHEEHPAESLELLRSFLDGSTTS